MPLKHTRLVVLLLAVGPTASPEAAPAGSAPTEITLQRTNQFAAGLSFTSPLGAQASLSLLHGLEADVAEPSEQERVRAACGAPIPHCAHGFVAEIGAGSGGGRLSLGVGALARIHDDGFKGVAGATFKMTLARTWGAPIGTAPNLSYLGPEMSLAVMHVGLDLGVLWRVSGAGGSSAVFSWGLGLRL